MDFRCEGFAPPNTAIASSGESIVGKSRVWGLWRGLSLLGAPIWPGMGRAPTAETLILGTDSTPTFYFAVQQLCVALRVGGSLPRSCQCHHLPTMSNSSSACGS